MRCATCFDASRISTLDSQNIYMTTLQTERLTIREFTSADANFILRLVNQPSWLRFIGDRGVHSLEEARKYIQEGPVSSYKRNGFGLYLVELQESQVPLGMCGLIKRDSLPDVDLGFAFMPEFWGQGFAREAAAAVLAEGTNSLGLKRILAITSQDNHSSIKLLEKLGFRFERMVRMPDEEEEIKLFALEI